MGRPRTPIGSHGVINLDLIRSGTWRARTLYRFPDGSRRQVQRIGTSRAKATFALQEALLHLAAPGGDGLRPTTTLAAAAAHYIDQKRDSGVAVRTLAAYEQSLRSIVIPRIGDLCLSEASPGRLQAFFTAVTKENGPGSARMCRSVLSGIFGLAIRDDAVRANPVRQVAPIRTGRSHATSALPLREVSGFISLLLEDQALRDTDVGPIFVFMALTGCRVGEALGLAWASVDLVHSKATFEATIVRMQARGLLRQQHGKTTASTRTITLAGQVVALLAARERRGAMVFPSNRGGPRDPVEVEAIWRRNRERLGYPTLTSHALRKTVATGLDEGGMSARAIAEYLGHAAPSITQDVYMSRNVGSEKLAAALDRVFGLTSDQGAMPIEENAP